MKMIYADKNHDSGVHAFEYGIGWIRVYFKKNNRPYTYSYSKAGVKHVDNMIKLALKGDGLNAYINKYCYNLYD